MNNLENITALLITLLFIRWWLVRFFLLNEFELHLQIFHFLLVTRAFLYVFMENNYVQSFFFQLIEYFNGSF